jgi:RimJ/RimL family protein N-acetyltransferase
VETTLLTPRVRLELETPEAALARVEALPPELRAEVSPEWLARVRASAGPDPYLHGFLALDRDTGAVVGGCGFKGPPDAEGTVEIAYAVEVEHQGRGYATEAAAALVRFAFRNQAVRVVRAHTRPENNASARVLTKCGFHCLGEVIDPEDGLVWRWERCPDPG